MSRAEEILDIEIPHYADENYVDIIRAVQTASSSVLNMGLKADENRLRHKQTDIIEQMYKEIKRERDMKTVNP